MCKNGLKPGEKPYLDFSFMYVYLTIMAKKIIKGKKESGSRLGLFRVRQWQVGTWKIKTFRQFLPCICEGSDCRSLFFHRRPAWHQLIPDCCCSCWPTTLQLSNKSSWLDAGQAWHNLGSEYSSLVQTNTRAFQQTDHLFSPNCRYWWWCAASL